MVSYHTSGSGIEAIVIYEGLFCLIKTLNLPCQILQSMCSGTEGHMALFVEQWTSDGVKHFSFDAPVLLDLEKHA